MNFISTQQEKAFHSAMKKKFKAAAFDVDGTLTHLGKPNIKKGLVNTLAHLPSHVPLAICTGREVHHLQSRLAHICETNVDGHNHRMRWTIFCENGSAGYTFDCKTQEYKKWFEIPWPEKEIKKTVLAAFITERLGWPARVVEREYSLVIRFPRFFYVFSRLVKRLSRKTNKRLNAILKELQLDHAFSAQDSGIGNIIIPHTSGKGKAIKLWAKRLKIPLQDILVVGDKAHAGGNDEEMLSGKFGTPFTVGSSTKNLHPFSVFDKRGRKLIGPDGTIELLSQVRF